MQLKRSRRRKRGGHSSSTTTKRTTGNGTCLMSSLARDTATSNTSTKKANGHDTSKRPSPSLVKNPETLSSGKSASKRASGSGRSQLVVSERPQPSRISVALVSLIALIVSLTHLSNGVIALADTPWWEGWAMAIVFDLFLVTTEWMLLTVTFTDRTGKIAAESILVMVVGWSMYLNALAFSHGHFDIDHLAPIGWGISLPYLILASVFAATRCK